MTTPPFPGQTYGEDVAVHHLPEKTVLLVGTAHISQQSTDLVQEIIEQERPDTLCIELDEKRFATLSRRQNWENLDLKQIIRSKQLATLLVNLTLAAYQKKLGGQMGVMPGTELLTAARTAQGLGIPVALCDRDVRVTLRRAWQATSFFKKGYLLATLLTSLFDRTELDEDKLAEMRRKDVLSELVRELGEALPGTKRALIDERDIYMAEQIKKAAGRRLVAVVGAGHLEGIGRALNEDNGALVESISIVPPVSRVWTVIGWLIPALIILGLVFIGLKHGIEDAEASALYWIMVTGFPSAAGAILALGHPATILSAFAAAPITTLSPLIGAGYVCAFIQVMACPPVVREIEAAGRDIGSFIGWWRNRLLRVFLVFLFTGIGAGIGTWLGSVRIVTDLFN